MIDRTRSSEAAFDRMVAANKQRVFSYVYRIIGHCDEAEDITQDVFVKMYIALPRFRSEASLTTWMYRIAGNLCIDRHRKRARRAHALGGEPVSLDEPSGDAGSPAAGAALDLRDRSGNEPEQMLARREQERHLQAALAALPIKMRSVVVLHDVQGLSYEEIAAIEQCPLGTVKSRLFNARAQLRTRLDPVFAADGEGD